MTPANGKKQLVFFSMPLDDAQFSVPPESIAYLGGRLTPHYGVLKRAPLRGILNRMIDFQEYSEQRPLEE